MKKWINKVFSRDETVEASISNKRLTASEKLAREDAKNLALEAAVEAQKVAAEKAQKVRDKASGTSPEKSVKATEKKRQNNATGKIFRDIISGKFLSSEGVVAHIPYLLFIVLIFVINISLGYKFEKIEKEKRIDKKALEEVTAEYKTLTSELEEKLQQSNVEVAIKSTGLDQPRTQPIILESNGE